MVKLWKLYTIIVQPNYDVSTQQQITSLASNFIGSEAVAPPSPQGLIIISF